MAEKSRRHALKRMLLASIGLGIASMLPLLKSATPAPLKIPEWPRFKVANIKDLEVGKPKIFMYPLENTPNILVKLGKSAQGGVGPEKDIVAYSQLCQHLGCFLRFVPAGQSSQYPDSDTFYCPCHAGIYDIKGQVLAGPPLGSLPQVLLQYDEKSQDIFAYNMGPPIIFGKGTPGSSELWRDLMGGTLVKGS